MTLTGRFSVVFLTALGLVLAGFSSALYVSARTYLHRQVGERLDGALDILAAAAEIHPGDVEWEPQERVLPVGQDRGADRLLWVVCDDGGRRVDHSRNLDEADPPPSWMPRGGLSELPTRLVDLRGRAWRVSRRRILPSSAPQTGSRVASNHQGDSDPADGGLSGTDLPEGCYPALVLTAWTPLAPTEATLSTLGWTLTGLIAGTWALAALLCRRLARRALTPLTRMVESARGLDASDAGWSLEMAGTGDELDDLGRAFNELLARLHLAYERQRRFGIDASHQLRTPLTVLIGQIEVTLRQERSGDEYRRTLRSALWRANQLAQIVEALLFLGRAEGDARVPEFETLNLNLWVARHVADRSPTARSGSIVLRLADGDGPLIRAHPPLLGQLLDNLLDNAEKHGPPGVPILVETALAGETAIVSVEDSGPGIPAADLPLIFEPFYRSEPSRRRGIPGAGLGLAVVRRIASAHGGSVDVRVGPEQGCRLEVCLPATAITAPSLRPTLVEPTSLRP